MKNSLFLIIFYMCSTIEYYPQQLRFFLEGQAGQGTLYQKQLVNFSPNLDIVNVTAPTTAKFVLTTSYKGKSFWRPGVRAGYFSNTFDMTFNGKAEYLDQLGSGRYEATKPNSFYENYIRLSYYTFSFRNEFTAFSTRKITLNTYLDLGLNIVNRSKYTLKKINRSFDFYPEDSYNFYRRFKNHAFIELGVVGEFARQRIGISAAYKRSITQVFENSEFSELGAFMIGIRYNFSKFNISKFLYQKEQNTGLKINDDTKKLSFGLRLSHPMHAKITTSGVNFEPNYASNGEVKVASGDFNLELDFPILPTLFVRQRLSKYFDLELSIGVRSYYMNVNVINITAIPTTVERDLVAENNYLNYVCYDMNTLFAIFQKKEHKIHVVAGFAAWRNISTSSPNELNRVKINNINLGVQYTYNRATIRLGHQRSFNNLKYNSTGDMKLKTFSYSELSLAYDIIQTNKKHRH